MTRQGTVNSLCREFPKMADQIRLYAAEIERDQRLEFTISDFDQVGSVIVSHCYRLYHAVFAVPNRPGDRILWLSDEGMND